MFIAVFIVSVVMVILSVAASFMPFVRKLMKDEKKAGIGIVVTLPVGLFLATFVIFLGTRINAGDNIIVNVLLSILDSVDAFGISGEFGTVEAALSGYGDIFKTLFLIWTAMLFFAEPMLAFGYIFYFFKKFFRSIRLFFLRDEEMYIFSEVSESALALAEDLKKNHPESVVVFTGNFDKDSENGQEYQPRMKKIAAVFIKEDIAALNLGKKDLGNTITFFVIGEDDGKNFRQTLELIEKYKKRINTNIYLFSTGFESELILPTVDKGLCKVRRINGAQSFINRIFFEKSELIFNSKIPVKNGVRHISAVVVGMGKYGFEMTKSLAWFGQMKDYDLSVKAFDKDPLAEDRFIAACPELMSMKFNGKRVENEAQYTINIRAGVDVYGSSFANEITSMKDATYVFVALGDDETNIRVAANLRMLFERAGAHPTIQAIVYSTAKKNALSGIKNFQNQLYDIDFIGDLKTTFSEDVILNSAIEEYALKCHRGAGYKEEDFWAFEYNYRSSVASAIHQKAVEKCIKEGHPGIDRDVEANIEHRRWNAYMRSEGYIYGKKRNDLGKMHPNLIDYESLSEETQNTDKLITANK